MTGSEREGARKRVGISRSATAKLAGVYPQLVQLYEANPEVLAADRRASLDRVYDGFAALAERSPGAHRKVG